MGTITSANSVYTLSIDTLFPTPQQLQNFSAEDIFTTDAIQTTEIMMGVDGYMAAGYVPQPIPQVISLMANSISNAIFDQWYQQQQLGREAFLAQGIILLPSISRKFTLTNGALTSYKPMSDAAKVLQPRRFSITWESMVGADA